MCRRARQSSLVQSYSPIISFLHVILYFFRASQRLSGSSRKPKGVRCVDDVSKINKQTIWVTLIHPDPIELFDTNPFIICRGLNETRAVLIEFYIITVIADYSDIAAFMNQALHFMACLL